MVTTTNLRSYYELEESASSTCSDSHGTDDGTYIGDLPTQIAGKVNYGQDLDGTGDAVQIDALVSSAASDTAGTFTAWVNLDNTGNSNTIIGLGDESSNSFLNFQVYLDKTYAMMRDTTEVKWNLNLDSTALTDATWHHIALVQNGTEPVLYVDGSAPAQTFSTSTDKTFWISDFTGATALDKGRIGILRKNGGDSGTASGIIDEVGYWSRALSSDDISDLYASGSGLAYPFAADATPTPSANTLSFSQGTPTYTIDIPSSGALSLSITAGGVTTSGYAAPVTLVSHIVGDTGGIGEKAIATRYPVTDGITGGTTRHYDHKTHKLPTMGTLIPRRKRIGL